MTKFNLGMQGWFNIKKAINIIHLINSLTQYQRAISAGTTKKHFDKSLHLFLTKRWLIISEFAVHLSFASETWPLLFPARLNLCP